MTVDFIIDRIDGTFTVLEWHGGTVDWPTALLPKESLDGGRVSFEVALTPPSHDAASDRLQRLRSRTSQTGDIDI